MMAPLMLGDVLATDAFNLGDLGFLTVRRVEIEDDPSLLAQRYSTSGSAIGEEFLVFEELPDDSYLPEGQPYFGIDDVLAIPDPAGGFNVIWVMRGVRDYQAGQLGATFSQSFDALGEYSDALVRVGGYKDNLEASFSSPDTLVIASHRAYSDLIGDLGEILIIREGAVSRHVLPGHGVESVSILNIEGTVFAVAAEGRYGFPISVHRFDQSVPEWYTEEIGTDDGGTIRGSDARVMALSDGNILVSWLEDTVYGPPDLLASIIPANDAPGDPITLSDTDFRDINDYEIIALSNGGIVLVTTVHDGESSSINLTRFDQFGEQVGPTDQLAETADGQLELLGVTSVSDNQLDANWRLTSTDSTHMDFFQSFILNTPPQVEFEIDGALVQGQILSTDTIITDPDGINDFQYQWLRDGVAIDGAVSDSFQLQQADVGATINLQISYFDDLGTHEVAISQETGEVENINDLPTGAALIDGNPFFRETLSANTESIADEDGLGELNYTWFQNNVAIAGETGASYVVQNTDIGQDISYAINYTDGFGNAEHVESALLSISDRAPGIHVEPSGTVTDEQGASVTLSVALDSAPTQDVLVTLAVSDLTEAGLDDPSITFAPDNWHIAQVVTLSGQDDYDDDGDVSFELVAHAESNDPDYDGVNLPALTFVNADDTEDQDQTILGTVQGDTLTGQNGDDHIYAGGGSDDVRGGRGSDHIYGEYGSDTLRGGDGEDAIYGGFDDDRIYGGNGDDTLVGELGDDWLNGEAGNDSIYGGDDQDTLIGGAGDDVLIGGTTQADLRDVAHGGDGNDLIDGSWGNDLLYGDAGADTIIGGLGQDTIVGGTGNDALTGQGWSDAVFGGDGDDFINGGFGHDRLNGGAGADRFFHLGIFDHGSDWVQDYTAADGDVLQLSGPAIQSQFQVIFVETPGAGQAGVEEAFVIYRPTGQILWALVDGAAQSEINLMIGAEAFDLLA
ncbi:MAG: hypothetical protein ACRBBS_15820 [Thalassovita sp.]